MHHLDNDNDGWAAAAAAAAAPKASNKKKRVAESDSESDYQVPTLVGNRNFTHLKSNQIHEFTITTILFKQGDK